MGGSGRPADGSRRVAGSGAGVPRPRQSGGPGRCGGVTCAIVPYRVPPPSSCIGRRHLGLPEGDLGRLSRTGLVDVGEGDAVTGGP